MLPPLLATLVVMAMMTSRVVGVAFRPGTTLLHLTVENSTGFVYVAAVNRIYHLTPDRLELASVAVTGTVFSYVDDRFPIAERLSVFQHRANYLTTVV